MHADLPTLRAAALLLVSVSLTISGCGKDGGGSQMGLINHDTFFKVTASHQSFTCDQCHDLSANSFSAALGGVDCVKCHVTTFITPGHAGVSGFVYATPSCIFCHKDGSTPPFAHAFVITQGAVHGPPNMTCVDCHGASSAPADLLCTGCHTGTTPHSDQTATGNLHTGVSSYVYNSPSCASCHPTGSVGLPANHDTADFPVTGSPSHGQLSCSQCHGATKAVADLTCISCHTQSDNATKHAAIPATTTGSRDGVTYTNYVWSSVYCVKCHADDQQNLIASHPSVSHGLNGEGHAPFCLTCHTTMMASGKTWAVDFSQYSCLACHTDNTGGGGGG